MVEDMRVHAHLWAWFVAAGIGMAVNGCGGPPSKQDYARALDDVCRDAVGEVEFAPFVWTADGEEDLLAETIALHRIGERTRAAARKLRLPRQGATAYRAYIRFGKESGNRWIAALVAEGVADEKAIAPTIERRKRELKVFAKTARGLGMTVCAAHPEALSL